MSTKGPWTAQEIEFRDELAQMAKLPENEECADCTAKAPKWAAFNHGIFICIKCSGCHRNIGRAISKVKSINLDRWLQDQFDEMCGNDMANRILLAHAPADFEKLDEHDDSKREKFIEKKYVKRVWAATPEEEAEIRAGVPISEQLPMEEVQAAPVAAVQQQQHLVQQIQSEEEVVMQPVEYEQQYMQQAAQPAFEQPVPPMAPPQQMNIENYAVPKVEDDLLDFFGTPASQVAQQPPPQQQAVEQPIEVEAPVIERAVQNTHNEADDIMDLFNQAPAQKQEPAEPAQQAQKSNKFDVSSFISNGERNTYKPTGFDW